MARQQKILIFSGRETENIEFYWSGDKKIDFLVVQTQKILIFSLKVLERFWLGGGHARGWTRMAPQGILDPPKAQNQRKQPKTKAKAKTPRAKEHPYTPGAQARWRIFVYLYISFRTIPSEFFRDSFLSFCQDHIRNSRFFQVVFRCLFGSIFDRSWLDFPSQLASQKQQKCIKNRCQ